MQTNRRTVAMDLGGQWPQSDRKVSLNEDNFSSIEQRLMMDDEGNLLLRLKNVASQQ